MVVNCATTRLVDLVRCNLSASSAKISGVQFFHYIDAKLVFHPASICFDLLEAGVPFDNRYRDERECANIGISRVVKVTNMHGRHSVVLIYGRRTGTTNVAPRPCSKLNEPHAGACLALDLPFPASLSFLRKPFDPPCR